MYHATSSYQCDHGGIEGWLLRHSEELGLGLRWTRFTVSSCSLGKRPRGSFLSSDRRKREIYSTSPSSTRNVFTLLSDLRRLCHSVGSTASESSSSDDQLGTARSRARCSTAGNPWLSELYPDLLTKVQHNNNPVKELELGIAEPEALCCIHKLQKMWDGNRGILEELNSGLLE
jgi:hypothetical protein